MIIFQVYFKANTTKNLSAAKGDQSASVQLESLL